MGLTSGMRTKPSAAQLWISSSRTPVARGSPSSATCTWRRLLGRFQAWGAPNSFARLAELLLTRGGADELLTFARGLMSSFDTFGACHQMRLPPETLPVLLQRAEVLLAQTGDKTEAALLESALDLLAELRAGTATDRWVVLPPGTPVSNMRIVPRWRILAGTAVRRARRLFRPGGDA